MAYNRKQMLTAKLETVSGVSADPTGAEVIQALDLDLTPLAVKELEREIVDGQFGNPLASVMAERTNAVSFGVYAAGSGVAGTSPALGLFLRAAGMNMATVAATSNTFSFITGGSETLTFAHHWDGNKHLGIGGKTKSWELKMTSSELPKFTFEVPAIYVPVTDAAMPTGIYSNQAPVVACNSSNTTNISLFGYSACLIDLSLKCDNEHSFVDNMGCAPHFDITNQVITGELKIERPNTLAIKDFYAIAEASTVGAFSLTHGTTAGNRFALSFPKVQLGAPKKDDAAGIAALSIPFMVRRTLGAYDPGTIAFT
jgi:hypothetical protein